MKSHPSTRSTNVRQFPHCFHSCFFASALRAILPSSLGQLALPWAVWPQSRHVLVAHFGHLTSRWVVVVIVVVWPLAWSGMKAEQFAAWQ